MKKVGAIFNSTIGKKSTENQCFRLVADTSRQILIPLVMKFLESSLEVEDSCLPLVVKQIGKLTFGLEKHLTLKNKIWFLNLFCR